MMSSKIVQVTRNHPLSSTGEESPWRSVSLQVNWLFTRFTDRTRRLVSKVEGRTPQRIDCGTASYARRLQVIVILARYLHGSVRAVRRQRLGRGLLRELIAAQQIVLVACR